MKKIIAIAMTVLLLLSGVSCGSSKDKGAELDYLVLVNKENKLPDNWEEMIKTVSIKNSLGDDVEVEEKAYDAYLELKEDLEKENVHVDLDSSRRSVAEQQKIWDDFTVKYGEDYTKRYVAVLGYSEHHTGLALDLYLNMKTPLRCGAVAPKEVVSFGGHKTLTYF